MLETVSKEHPSIYANAVCNRLSTTLRIYKLMYMRNGLKKFSSQGTNSLSMLKVLTKQTAKKYLSKKDYIRYKTLCTSKKLYFLMIKYLDKY